MYSDSCESCESLNFVKTHCSPRSLVAGVAAQFGDGGVGAQHGRDVGAALVLEHVRAQVDGLDPRAGQTARSQRCTMLRYYCGASCIQAVNLRRTLVPCGVLI